MDLAVGSAGLAPSDDERGRGAPGCSILIYVMSKYNVKTIGTLLRYNGYNLTALSDLDVIFSTLNPYL